MLELHQIRIKIKRFRYALQTLPEVPRDSNLLRRLKRLQDMLGFLHDDFINAKLVQCFLEDAGNVQLRYEAGLFVGWERAKAALRRNPRACPVAGRKWRKIRSRLAQLVWRKSAYKF